MPRAGWVKPQDDQRLTDHVALGVLSRTFPPGLVDAVIGGAGREQRRSRLLPSRLVVYYVLAMALFSSAGYEEVMRHLVEGLSWESGWRQEWAVPSQPAISQARARLGPEPLELLFARACVPLGARGMPGAFYRRWRLVSMDGSTLDAADTPENEEAFGRAGSGRGEGRGAFPQVRLVALAECGTHAMFAVAMGAFGDSEQILARDLVAALTPGMLVLADRGFTAHPLFSVFAATGADLCWRAKGNAALPVLERLVDGLTGLSWWPTLTGGPAATCCPSGSSNMPWTIPAGPAPANATGWSPRSQTPMRLLPRNWPPSTPNGGSSRPPWMR
jgi:hypothetical protein